MTRRASMNPDCMRRGSVQIALHDLRHKRAVKTVIQIPLMEPQLLGGELRAPNP